jgi:cytochrome c-type biogenesis protein CcmF
MDGFTGEHLLPGKLGHLFVILSFVAAIVATFSYYKATVARLPEEQERWRRLARIVFLTEFAAVIGIAVCLFYILFNHYYEYSFAYKHSNNSLERKYLLSCFWEGQEGSFWVWIFWHCILGTCVMFSAKKWEAPVMATLNFVQIFLTAFLLGLYFKDFHIGSSPFVLLRNSEMGKSFANAPMLTDAATGLLKKDYLSFFKDGQGLNILLQNRWMVIHPPTLFFGFASCTIPFAFAVAGLWRRDYGNWIKPVLPWTLLATCILGVGILMGAIWAYESLSFGGYWAWDPVENASLVPWLILVAGLHTMLIYKHTGYSLRAAFLFIILAFALVIYSTYLTRSGVLQNTSVHAFTGAGMTTQLIIMLAVTCLSPLVLLAMRYQKIPAIVKEEKTWSREFWMFIGALVFFLSALFIIIATSLPVLNKIFAQKWALGENSEAIYNKVHIPIVIVLGLLIGCTQYLKYKDTGAAYLRKKLLWPLVASIGMCIVFALTVGIDYMKEGVVVNGLLYAALFTSVFSAIANVGYLLQVVRKSIINWGSSLSHLGFALLVTGIIISSSNKKLLSLNNPAVNVFKDRKSAEDPRESLNLLKGVPVAMQDYRLTFTKEETDRYNDVKKHYFIDFSDSAGKQLFHLSPTAYLKVKGQEGISPEPAFKRYLHKDLFLYITSLTDPELKNKPNDYVTKQVLVGDTVYLDNGLLILKSREVNPRNGKYNFSPKDTAFAITTEIHWKDGNTYTAQPAFHLKNDQAFKLKDSIPELGLYFRIEGVTEDGKLNFSILDKNYKVSDFITVKVLEFPLIRLMWLGMTVMSIGLMISMLHRIRLQNRTERSAARAENEGLTKP